MATTALVGQSPCGRTARDTALSNYRDTKANPGPVPAALVAFVGRILAAFKLQVREIGSAQHRGKSHAAVIVGTRRRTRRIGVRAALFGPGWRSFSHCQIIIGSTKLRAANSERPNSETQTPSASAPPCPCTQRRQTMRRRAPLPLLFLAIGALALALLAAAPRASAQVGNALSTGPKVYAAAGTW